MHGPKSQHRPGTMRSLRSERGDSATGLLIIVPILILLMGLIVDGAGKIQADEQAAAIAHSAARAGANAGALPDNGTGEIARINPAAARAAAERFLSASGAAGSVQADATTVYVTAQVSYQPKFLPLGGLTGEGQGNAELRRNSP